jgi:hypothetical protein
VHLLKAVLVRVALLGLGLVVGLALTEIGLRVFEPGRLAMSRREKDLFCRFDRELGWAPLENVTAIHSKGVHSGWVHQNQFGMRGSDDARLQRTSAQPRILVLGDSYAWGFAVAQNAIFSAPEVYGTNAEVLNFGVSGYGTDQEYLLYLRKGVEFAVDEVVVAFTPYNDVENNLAPEQYGYLKPYFTLENQHLVLHTNHIRNDWSRLAANFIRQHSRFWNRLGDLSRTFQKNVTKVEDSTGAARAGEAALYTAKDVSERDRRGVELTIAILSSLRDAVLAHHAKFCVIFVPYKPNIEARLPGNHPLVPLLADGLTKAGIDYIEPYPEFLRAAEDGVHPFNDPDNHFSPAGHALFAKFLSSNKATEACRNYYARRHDASE